MNYSMELGKLFDIKKWILIISQTLGFFSGFPFMNDFRDFKRLEANP
jgi:hypothetical protein